MTRILLLIILISLLSLSGCDSPRSLKTAQMAPAIMPVSQNEQAEVDSVSIQTAEDMSSIRPDKGSVIAGRR